ncbi:hypothetical protein [Methyloferula stellata]|uniref:hypothetical protein n=1 Tax=Methyloferula stellata TaxID=876270 RepID=UPI00035E6DDC|nr:hypothetical protein [Methyloferula stellata]
MLHKDIRKLLLGGTAALSLAGFALPVLADDGAIRIAVAVPFADTLNDIIGSWHDWVSTHDGLNYTATAYTNANSVLFNQIISSSTSFYDLFFAVDTATPNNLFYNYTTYVSTPPFNYAIDGLALSSRSINVSASGLPYPLTGHLFIENPAVNPYGLAAYTLLNDTPWSAGFTTVAGPFAPNGANATQNDVYTFLTLSQEFTLQPKSRICRASSTAPYTAAWETTLIPRYVYEYYAEGGGSSDPNVPATVPTSDANGSHPFPNIVQAAIQINGTGSSAALQSFLNYLKGRTTYPNKPARDIIKSYCYRWAIGQ